MIPIRARVPLLASGAGLILALGFPDSLGLWPVRLVADWPGEIGRALASLIADGKLGPLALSQAADFALTGTGGARALEAALGQAVQLAAGVALFWLAEKPKAGRGVLLALAGASAIAAIAPPVSTVSAAELGATLALALLGLSRAEIVPRTGLQMLAGVMVTAPLAELRPALLSIGRPAGAIAALESATGVPALVWALVTTASAVAGLLLLLRDKPAKVRAA